jgi:hypothetical protein
VFEEVAQEFLFACGEGMNFVIVAEFEAIEVDADIAEADDVFCGSDEFSIKLSATFIEEVTYAAEEFGEREGFGDILINTAVERLDFVFGESSGGESDDGDIEIESSEAAADFVAAHFREHEIEDYEIDGWLGEFVEFECSAAIGGDIDAVAFAFEVEPESFGDGIFIFDNENSHAVFS